MKTGKADYIGFYNGMYTRYDDLSTRIDSLGANRGYAAFDFLKVINKVPFFAERHIERFLKTMSLLRIQPSFSPEDILEIISTLIDKNEHPVSFVKLFAIPKEPVTANQMKADLYILPVDMPNVPETVYTDGAKLISKEYMRFLPEAKSTNYLASVYWQHEISRANAIEVLYCYDKLVYECSRSNIFVLKNGRIKTPEEGVLKGITRSITIDLIDQIGFDFIQEKLRVDKLFSADEIFITSTTKGIAPIVNIDGRQIADGKIGKLTKQLVNAYQSLLKTWPEIKS